MSSDQHEFLFGTLVTMLGQQALVAMGKLKNPVTDTVERDLHTARVFIDMLEALQARTQGNLNAEETKLLDRTLSDLRLNYVYEANTNTNPSSPDAIAPDAAQADAEGIPGNVA